MIYQSNVMIYQSNELSLHSKLVKTNQTTMDTNTKNVATDIKKLKVASLPVALKEMAVGETCIAPDGYAPRTVRVACTDLRAEGYLFQTSTRTGIQTITRLK